jgi:hypothetical protein
MTPEELDAIEARASRVYPEDSGWNGTEAEDALPVVTEDVPALVAEVRRLRGELASVTEDRDSIRTVAVEAEAEIHGLRSDRLALRREVDLLRAEVDRLSR